jgi:hypothetical protein
MFGFNFRSLRKLKPIHHFFRSRILADDILKGKYETKKSKRAKQKYVKIKVKTNWKITNIE